MIESFEKFSVERVGVPGMDYTVDVIDWMVAQAGINAERDAVKWLGGSRAGDLSG